MIKKTFFTIITLILLSTNSFSAGSSSDGGDSSKVKSNYDKAVTLIKEAKKYEKQQEWPILFHIKKRPECWRVLFEHDNGELYQLDVEDSIFNSLKLRLEEERKH